MRRVFLLLFLCSCFFVGAQNQFKGVWISTVKRLDYPSRTGLNSYQLKNEFTEIADSCNNLGINALIFQIRPAADAFFVSPYEPWSEWLTGKQGKAPKPFFDPLEFMIEQTHLRQMQFHAWINPFRAIATITHADIADNHITKLKPEWFFDYGNNRYFNPGIPQVQDYLVKVIVDIVKRYNIDGIHFDDYFYPYPLKNSKNKIIPIPDYNTFKKYGENFTNIKEWRRYNINKFVHRVHDSIKNIKPWVKFGISPPAVWRNKGYDANGSATLGLASYDWIYADVLFWLKNKWVDYIAPQLYWHMNHKRANYKILVKWWHNHNYDTDLYIGLNVHSIDKSRTDPNWGNPDQIPEQIRYAQSFSSVKGFILYRYESLSKNPLGIKDSLKNNFFADTSVLLIAKNDTSVFLKDEKIKIANKTKKENPPLKPINIGKYNIGNEITILWDSPSDMDSIKYFAVYKLNWQYNIKLDSNSLFKKSEKNYIRFKRKRFFNFLGKKYKFVIVAVGKNNLKSKPSKPVFIRIRN